MGGQITLLRSMRDKLHPMLEARLAFGSCAFLGNMLTTSFWVFWDLNFLWDPCLYFSFLVQFHWCWCKWIKLLYDRNWQQARMICGTGEGSGFQFLHKILQWEVFYKSIDMNPASLSSLQLDFCSEDGPGMLVLANMNYVSSSGCTQKEQHFTLHLQVDNFWKICNVEDSF